MSEFSTHLTAYRILDLLSVFGEVAHFNLSLEPGADVASLEDQRGHGALHCFSVASLSLDSFVPLPLLTEALIVSGALKPLTRLALTLTPDCEESTTAPLLQHVGPQLQSLFIRRCDSEYP